MEPEDEAPEAFLKSLLVDNWTETKLAYDKLDDSDRERFSQYLNDKECMKDQISTELEINVLSKSMTTKTV